MKQRVFTDRAPANIRHAFRQLRALQAACIAFDATPPLTQDQLEQFLKATARIDELPQERLRQLGIFLEQTASWVDLNAIYALALSFAPKDARIYHSIGLSARRLLDRDDDLNPAIFSHATYALNRALALDPHCAETVFTRGLLELRHGPSKAAALLWFEWALEMRPANPSYQVFVAHTCYDLEDWPKAIAAYRQVHLAALEQDGPPSRVTKVRARLGRCHVEAGYVDEGRQTLIALLAEIESWDTKQCRRRVAEVDDLFSVACSRLPELMPRIKRLAEVLEQSDRYDWNCPK